MRKLHPDLWVCESPLRFFGLEVGTRMTIVRLPDSRLWVHSPIGLSETLLAKVEELGPVAHVIAPNQFHHLFVADWQRAFPDARVHIAPGLDAKRPDLGESDVLSDEPHPDWSEVLDQVQLKGMPMVNETVFFHQPSSTLIATDLAFHIGPESPLLTRIFMWFGGAYNRLAPTHLEKLLLRDRQTFREGLERILEWPFERVIVSHGRISESGGREALREGYSWVLG